MNANLPVIPETITVHLGPPDSDAENITLSFLEYISNVASSEIYPTWPENAVRANMYAQISFALNRIYTEYYRLPLFMLAAFSSIIWINSALNFPALLLSRM